MPKTFARIVVAALVALSLSFGFLAPSQAASAASTPAASEASAERVAPGCQAHKARLLKVRKNYQRAKKRLAKAKVFKKTRQQRAAKKLKKARKAKQRLQIRVQDRKARFQTCRAKAVAQVKQENNGGAGTNPGAGGAGAAPAEKCPAAGTPLESLICPILDLLG